MTLSLKPADDSEEVVVLDPEPPPPSSQNRGSLSSVGRRIWSRLSGVSIAGLDIGTSTLKAVVLHRAGDRIELGRIGYASTPQEALTSNVLTDSVAVSEHIRSLFKDYQIRAKRVTVATGSEKVLCQTERLGWSSPEERLALIEQSVASTIPYPFASAAVSFEEVDKPETGDGVLFWASAPMDHVDWLRETVVLAGKKPVIADTEACALANTVIYNYRPESTAASVLLHIGVQKIVIGLLVGERLEYARSVRLSRAGADEAVVPFPDRVRRGMDRFWDTIEQRAKPLDLRQVYLSGGPVQVEKLGEAVHSQSGLPVIEVNPFREIEYSTATAAGKLAREGGSTFAVAVGLALRGFEDL